MGARHAAALVIGLGVLAAPADAHGVRPAGVTTPLGSERLSNEQTLTRWAHPVRLVPIRARPAWRSSRRADLRAMTEDGVPEVYLALRSRRAANGRVWIRVRIPGRPNGRTGWVRRDALGRLHVVR